MVLQRSHNGYDEDCTKGLSSSLWWWDSQRRWAEDRRSKQTQRVPCLHVSFSFSLAEGKKRNRAFVGKLCASNIKHWCKCLMFNLLLQLLLALLQEIESIITILWFYLKSKYMSSYLNYLCKYNMYICDLQWRECNGKVWALSLNVLKSRKKYHFSLDIHHYNCFRIFINHKVGHTHESPDLPLKLKAKEYLCWQQ